MGCIEVSFIYLLFLLKKFSKHPIEQFFCHHSGWSIKWSCQSHNVVKLFFRNIFAPFGFWNQVCLFSPSSVARIPIESTTSIKEKPSSPSLLKSFAKWSTFSGFREGLRVSAKPETKKPRFLFSAEPRQNRIGVNLRIKSLQNPREKIQESL